ncbi:MAG: TIGR02147 family protein [Silvanigrellaceae bacterium]
MMERKPKTKSLKEIVDEIDVFAFLSVQDLLSHAYEELKKQLPRYSYRAFSRDLGFGETNYLHLICTHKRQLSLRSAQQVASHLGLHNERRTWFLSLVEHTAGRHNAQRAEGIKKAFEVRQKTLGNDLTRDEMEFFGRWFHPVVRELIARSDFSPDPKWICQRVRPRITPDQAKQSLELQIRLGYVEVVQDNQHRLTHSHIRVPEGVNNLAIHKYHQEMLQLSERSLSEVDAAERDLSALTVKLSAEQIPEIKNILREARRKIVALSDTNTADADIFQLNMQLFPVTGNGK